MIYSSMSISSKKKHNEENEFSRSIFPPDVNVSERQTQAIANAIRIHGTNLLKQARSLFLWKNLTNSILVNFIRRYSFSIH